MDSFTLQFTYDVPWEKLNVVCQIADLRYIAGNNLSTNNSQFNCKRKGCDVNCNRIEEHDPLSTPIPTIDAKLKDSVYVNEGNKKMKYSQSDIMTQIFTATLTQKEVVVLTETIENGTVTDTESTSYILVNTYVNIDVVAQTLVLIELIDTDDTTKSNMSPGQLLVLLCGVCVIAFIVAFLGLFLYRRSRDKSDFEEGSSEYEMEDDIGHVIYSDEERIISDGDINTGAL
ncbi:hypothetical protein TVAGG3_0321890 [Trichomonas vaginalis G3]|nr:hypothetical protein TVAGG3_0321890 [Trichomonas vaginalis G3]KAI5529357.1 hypothetical protein TVAGG3_0321890 [Trichomonas vaginalis G3]